MAGLSNKERAELKRQGYVYDRHLGKWMHHEEQKEYYKEVEKAESLERVIVLIAIFGIFIWFLVMAGNR